jgi:hypothetical protein
MPMAAAPAEPAGWGLGGLEAVVGMHAGVGHCGGGGGGGVLGLPADPFGVFGAASGGSGGGVLGLGQEAKERRWQWAFDR